MLKIKTDTNLKVEEEVESQNKPNTEENININNTTSVISKLDKIDLNIDSSKILAMKHYEEELDYGNVEYKLKLVNTSKERIQGLITQMKFRLQEGNGECFYQIGIEDNGNPIGLSEDELKASLETLYTMTQQIGAKMSILNYVQGKEGLIAEIMVTKPQEKIIKDKLEFRIGLVGEEGSGKSTLVIIKNKFFCAKDRLLG